MLKGALFWTGIVILPYRIADRLGRGANSRGTPISQKSHKTATLLRRTKKLRLNRLTCGLRMIKITALNETNVSNRKKGDYEIEKP